MATFAIWLPVQYDHSQGPQARGPWTIACKLQSMANVLHAKCHIEEECPPEAWSRVLVAVVELAEVAAACGRVSKHVHATRVQTCAQARV